MPVFDPRARGLQAELGIVSVGVAFNAVTWFRPRQRVVHHP